MLNHGHRALLLGILVSSCAAQAQEPPQTPRWVEGGAATIAREFAPRSGRPANPDDLLRLVRIGDFKGGLTLSPDGRTLAVVEARPDIENNRVTHRLVVIDAESGATSVPADAGLFLYLSTNGRRSGDARARSPIWSPDGAYVAFIAEREGRAELWLAGLTREARRAADLAGDVQTFAWSEDGALVARIGTPREELDRIAANDARYGFAMDSRFSPLYGLLRMPDENAHAATVRIDMRTGQISPASEADQALLAPGASRNPRAIIRPVGPYPNASQPPLAPALQRAEDDVLVCALSACEGVVTEAHLSSDGETIYFVRRDANGAEMSVHAWRWRSDEARLVYTTLGALLGCQLGETTLFCIEETVETPRRVIAISLANGDARVVFDPNPDWHAIAQPRVDRISVRDGEGNRSFGRLIYPLNWRSGRRYPLVIVQYRARGFLNAGVGGEYPMLPMSARGYFVLAVDRPEVEAVRARLPWRETVTQTELDGSENAVKLAAIALMLRSIHAERLVDPDRVAITGMSDGAETLFAALDSGWRFRAAITSSPPTDPASWWLMSDDQRRRLQTDHGMTGPDNATSPWAAWWARMNSAAHASTYETPLLLNLSETELLYALPLRLRLIETGRPFDLYFYPDSYHVKPHLTQIAAAQERNLAWLDLWLRNRDSDSAIDPDRRARWRALADAHDSASR